MREQSEASIIAHLSANAVLAKYPDMITTLDAPPAIDGYILSLYIMGAATTAQLVLGRIVHAELLSPVEKYLPIETDNRQNALAGVMYYADLYYQRFTSEYKAMAHRMDILRQRQAGRNGAAE